MQINTKFLFLDTSVYVRYIPNLKSESLFKKVFPYKLITCSELLFEIKDVCLREQFTFRFKDGALDSYHKYVDQSVALIKYNSALHFNEPILITENIPVTDPKDWYIHNLALQNDVTIITGDKHLLQLKNVNYPIIPVLEFLTNV
jgi:predicted nucleic acid-binding protein